MAGFQADDVVGRVRDATDIVGLISAYVPLKRSGARFKALCPFHEEKTPSFIVTPQRQLWKCFGCGEGGDCFSFVMKHERVGFAEALRMLAERAGIEIKGRTGGSESADDKKAIFEANAWAADVYHRFLIEAEGAKKAREYLDSRGINADMVEKFKLGCAPDAWDGLLKHAKKKGMDVKNLERAGLVVKRESGQGFYDRFRGRLIFPICDAQGRAIGFGARVLDDSLPKYINSPETAVFSKSRTLYALDLAKKAILDGRKVAIFEGYTDVIMAHEHGVDWTVAVLGTALTREHVRTLRRFADEVILVFDTDTAGQKASDRSLDVFLEEEVEVKVAALSAGKDPCDFILQEGAEAFTAVLEQAKELIRYKIEMAFPQGKDTSPEHKSLAIDEILSTIAHSPNPALADLLLKEVAERIEPMGDRQRQLERALYERLTSLKRGVFRQTDAGKQASNNRESAFLKAERQIVQSMLAVNELIAQADRQELLGLFKGSDMQAAAERIFEIYHRTGSVDAASLLATADAAVRRAAEVIVGQEGDGLDYPAQFQGAMAFLRREYLKEQRDQAKARMDGAGKAGDEAEYRKWLDKYNKMVKEIAAL